MCTQLTQSSKIRGNSAITKCIYGMVEIKVLLSIPKNFIDLILFSFWFYKKLEEFSQNKRIGTFLLFLNHSSTQKTLEIHTRIFSAGKITCKARSAGAIFQASFKDSCQGFSSGLRYEQANGFARGHRMHTRLHTQNIKESVGLVQQCSEFFFQKIFYFFVKNNLVYFLL